ncbi:hypothetical protein J6590_027158 [Homalodisca vitripennis]|nr:hypothetical protein J6590_027158 [Homalodisca vitripennis]
MTSPSRDFMHHCCQFFGCDVDSSCSGKDERVAYVTSITVTVVVSMRRLSLALSRYLSLINRCPMSSCKYHCLGLWLIWSDTEPSFREDVGLCPGSGVSCPVLSCRKFSIRSHLRGLGDSCPNLGLGRPLRQRATRAELQPKTGA